MPDWGKEIKQASARGDWRELSTIGEMLIESGAKWPHDNDDLGFGCVAMASALKITSQTELADAYFAIAKACGDTTKLHEESTEVALLSLDSEGAELGATVARRVRELRDPPQRSVAKAEINQPARPTAGAAAPPSTGTSSPNTVDGLVPGTPPKEETALSATSETNRPLNSEKPPATTGAPDQATVQRRMQIALWATTVLVAALAGWGFSRDDGRVDPVAWFVITLIAGACCYFYMRKIFRDAGVLPAEPSRSEKGNGTLADEIARSQARAAEYKRRISELRKKG